MFFIKKAKHQNFDIWPGFVDAIATLLLVIIFVLMTFVLAQFYLTDALSDRDHALSELAEEIETLKNTLSKTQYTKNQLESTNQDLTLKLTTLESTEKLTQEQLAALTVRLAEVDQEKLQALNKIASLEETLKKLNLALDQAQQSTENQHLIINKVKDELAGKSEDLDRLSQRLVELLQKIVALEQQNVQLKSDVKKGDFGNYRSEFFAKLQKAIGDRSDIRIVGDRFVFQSEVLFDLGSAELGAEGKKQLDALSKALKEITEKIPAKTSWILRVDGHTDQLPIRSKYPSNWELSTERSISVVKYLISQGIAAKHLVAAGFGEFQPLEDSKDIKVQARNRRIEFKLDQR